MAEKIAESFIDEMRWRGLLYDMTEGAEEALKQGPITAYIGFDPTADSLHVGSLLPIMVLVHLQRHGHTPIVLAGGGTGMIGDPSGKSKERQLLTMDELEHNLEGIKGQITRFLKFEDVPNPALMVNNGDWLRDLKLIEFMRDVGKHFTVNYMMAKESVKQRLESEEGISYTEFTYMLLQAFDFVTLYRLHNCTFQMGGSDQWGNITAGTTLVRRMEGAEVHGVTMPLVTSSSGVKFGKSQGNNVWLDAQRTSPFRFYQYWLNIPDDDVIDYLKFFTLLSREEIEAIEESFEAEPHLRLAQRTLAEDVTRRVHGEAALEKALLATDVLFGNRELEGLNAEDLLDVFAEVPSSTVAKSALEGEGIAYVDLAADAGLDRSKGQIRKLVKNGGMYLNNQRVEDTDQMVTLDDAIDGEVIVLRKGKKSYHLVRVEG